MFVRGKRKGKSIYYYLVESKQEHQKHLAYIGKQIPDSLQPFWKKRKQK